jgi:hypothetical protein
MTAFPAKLLLVLVVAPIALVVLLANGAEPGMIRDIGITWIVAVVLAVFFWRTSRSRRRQTDR